MLRPKRPTSQPTTPKAEITPGGFSEAVATYHERLAAPLDAWVPHRPERPVSRGLSRPLKVKSAYEPAGDQPVAFAELTDGVSGARVTSPAQSIRNCDPARAAFR